MSVATRRNTGCQQQGARHPNEIDQLRVERAISQRSRYRYVTPTVLPVQDGYLVRSPCCSRTVSPEGEEVDVAWLHWIELTACWALYRKDHAAECWVEDGRFARLPELFARLNADPNKQFWQ